MNFMKKFRNALIGSSVAVAILIAVAVTPQSCHASTATNKATNAASQQPGQTAVLNPKLLAASDKDVQKMLDTEQSLQQRLVTKRELMEVNHDKQRIKLQAKIDLGDADPSQMDDLRKDQAKQMRELNMDIVKRDNNIKTLTAIVTNHSKLMNHRIDLIQKAAMESSTLSDQATATLDHQLSLNSKAIEGVKELQEEYEKHQIDSAYRLERDRRTASWN
jgi:hypothetical protein